MTGAQEEGSEEGHPDERIAVADTSVFIAREHDHPLSDRMPGRIAVSVVTIGELRLGVLAARDGPTRAQRLGTLTAAMALEPLPVDERVAHAWAALRVLLRDADKRMPLNDSWIAATAIANGLAIASQVSDYDGLPDLEVIRV